MNMEGIESFIKSASEEEKQILGKFVEDIAECLRKESVSVDIPEDLPAQSVEPGFLRTITTAPTAMRRPCTADMAYDTHQRVSVDPMRPMTAPLEQAEVAEGADFEPLEPLEHKPKGLPSKGSILETRRPTPARKTREDLLQEYIEKKAMEREGRETRQSTRSVLENKYRPKSRASEIRARTAHRVSQSRMGTKEPSKFEETLREGTDRNRQENEQKLEDTECCLRRKLINSIVEQMSDMDLDKLEQIIAGGGLKPVSPGEPSRGHTRAKSAPAVRIANPYFAVNADAKLLNHTGGNFLQVDKPNFGHFVINPQFVSENTELTNREFASIHDLL